MRDVLGFALSLLAVIIMIELVACYLKPEGKENTDDEF
jgi:hypothetical protein